MATNAKELMRLMVVREPEVAAPRDPVVLAASPKLAALVAGLSYQKAREALARFGDDRGNVFRAPDEVPHAADLDALRKAVKSGEDARAAVKRVFGQEARALVNADWKATTGRVADSVLYYKLAYPGGPRPLAELADLYRAARLVMAAAESRSSGPDPAILDAPLALPPPFARSASQAKAAANDPLAARKKAATDRAIARVREIADLAQHAETLETSLHELAALPIDTINFTPRANASSTAPEGATEVRGAHDRGAVAWAALRHALATSATIRGAAAPQPDLHLTSRASAALSSATRSAVGNLGLDLHTQPIAHIAQALAGRRDALLARQAELSPGSAERRDGIIGRTVVSHTSRGPARDTTPPAWLPTDLRLLPEIKIDWDDLLTDCGWPGQPQPEPDLGPSLIAPAGVGELFVIRQHILGYATGEVSHVENVLPGETRERTHRRLRQQEDTTTTEQENVTEDEKSLQTTTRAELDREVQSTIKRQFDYGATAQVSGDYGKIEFSASGHVQGSSASETASKTAQKVASEVIETSRQKVTEKVRTERVRRTLEEIEETNVHKFSGEQLTVPMNGVYQWIDKVYRNEVWSYGARTMYEVVVPEPAAGIIAAVTAPDAPATVLVERPKDLNISIATLDPATVARQCALYGVTEEIDPYPEPLFTGVAFSQSADASAHNNFYAETKDIDVPDGYVPVEGWIAVRARGEGNTPLIGVTIGDVSKQYKTDNIKADAVPTSAEYFTFPLPQGPTLKKLQAAVALDDYSTFAISVLIHCRPSPAKLDTWRHSAYAAIRSAYDARLGEWREYQSQVDFEKPDYTARLFGKNPESSRVLARTELQRCVIEVFRNQSLDYDLVREGTTADPIPRTEFASLSDTAPEILFLSQAFEWSNMTFVLYPYFFGRRNEWPFKLGLADTDANLIEFLKAGAARVQVPVRPGWEAAVDHYMITREPFFGQGMPEIGDPLYLPYLDEARDAMGASQVGTHRPTLDFDVTVPTDLVVARDGGRMDVDGGVLPAWEKSNETWSEKPA